MPVTLEVSRPERSREASEEQPENMEPMYVTLEVSRPERSREASEEQPSNMPRMLVAFEASIPEKSTDFNAAWSANALSNDVVLGMLAPENERI